MRSATVSVVAAAAVLLSGSIAQARDFCFNSTSPPNPAPLNNPDILVVAQQFSLPRRGKCKVVTGFEIASTASNPPQTSRPVSGTACLNADGNLLRASFTVHDIYNSAVNTTGGIHRAFSVSMDIPYPSLSGGYALFRLSDSDNGSIRQDVVAGPCGFPIPFF